MFSRARLDVWLVAAGVLVTTVVVTWPLALRLGDGLPGDYGDPLFVTWVMGWVNGRLTQGAFAGLWDANIFFPEADTLAFSEHFLAQSVMTLPVYWVTGNPILAYNVAFILTFVLTGAGTFLLTRALTASTAAGVVAAFVAAFNEYRLVYEVAHLHTLSIHWLPFALYALYRYFETDRYGYLVWAVAAMVALNLSSIYYMAYCAPLIVVFALAGVWRSGRWRTGRLWLELWAAAAAVAVLTVPVLLPYMEVQARLGVSRSIDEVIGFSATLDHYRAALAGMSAPLVLAVAGVAGGLAMRSLRWTVLTLSLLLGLAFWLSLGPVVQSGGQALGPGPYILLHKYVPGFEGLRVPARFAMPFFVFLAVLAGSGVAIVERRSRRAAAAVATVAAAVFLWQATPVAFPISQPLPSAGLVTPPPAYLTPATALPPIYAAVDALPRGAILAELPFGDSWYDLRYMYFSALHRRRLLNGYSGIFPPTFLARQRILTQPLLDPEAAVAALGGATHVVVHRLAWPDDTGRRLGAWLESLGARPISEADGAVLYALPVREQLAWR